MSSTVEVPVWLVVVIVVIGVLAAVDLFLLPGVRWVLRRRVNRVIADVNSRLRVELPTFQLTRREVLIDRLTYDPHVMDAVRAAALERGVPRQALIADVARYARELVPAFNAYFYFRLGYWLARRFLRMLYRVRLGFAHEAALADVPPNTSVVFFINHRSNLDYLLVTYLSSSSAAVSYGAGEWCRFWPFRSVLRLAGAYIIRRDTRDPLYRKVVERYVQIATRSGVPHAIFGEGKLSRNGAVNPPKLGLLGYLTKTFDPDSDYDILFVPVATNFDRVVEDRTLVANTETDFRGRGAVFVLGSTAAFVARQLWRRAIGRWRGYGTACANFGEPLSLKAWSRERDVNFSRLHRDQLFAHVEQLGEELTDRVINVMPVLPVPAIARALIDAPEPVGREQLKRRAHNLMDDLRRAGSHVAADEASEDAAIEDGLRLLTQRGIIVQQEDHSLTPAPHQGPLLEYYANSIAQLCSQMNEQMPSR